MTTNVPQMQFTDQGVVLPDESDILAGRMADINAAFGGGVNQQLSSPQGQIAQSDSAIIGDKNAQIAEISNQVNPDYADGRWQDAIGKIYFMERIAAYGTVVTCTCIGLVNTYIPAGSQVQDNSGYIYSSLADAYIPATGSVDIDFQCLTTGPISTPANTVVTIYRAIFGWDRVNNAEAGTPGVDVESRADFESRRRQSVAANAVNSVQSVRASVLAVPGVLDAYVYDNGEDTAITLGSSSVSVKKHSIYVAVVGGTSSDIAHAIWKKKAPGCDYNGSTTFTVYDDDYPDPKPSYEVSWTTPTALPIFFDVKIKNNSGLPGDIQTKVKEAITSAFNGDDGGARARIGSWIYASRYYAPVFAISPDLDIQSILIGTTSPGAVSSVLVGVDQRPTITDANITVTLVS